MRRTLPMLGLIAASGLSFASLSTGPTVIEAPRRDRYKPSSPGDFDPKINRHTGKPHEHKREIARRLRQRAGVSRSDAERMMG